jgi:CMP-N,N'-diacetyllegionaminic acid synthase
MAVLAIIPARGGSKGVPRKNLRQVGDRSLLVRAIEASRNAAGVDRVFVSTDDGEIQQEARLHGADASVLRPAALATDQAPTLPVLQHAVQSVEAVGVIVDIIVLVEPTSPFRTANHVGAALERFRRGDCRSVVTVTELERKPENIFVKDVHLRRYIERPLEHFARRQEMAHLCRINSAVYVVGRDDLMAGKLTPEPVGWVEMDAKSSINIDTPVDLAFADFLARNEDTYVRG